MKKKDTKQILEMIEDKEWAETWKIVEKLYEEVENIENLFKQLDVSYLREMHQKLLVLNMRKYIWTLKGYIMEKFGENNEIDNLI